MKFQTKLKDCNCENGGIIIYEGTALCRWCRTPYANGGYINYEPEHFKKESNPIVKDKDYEIVSFVDVYNQKSFFTKDRNGYFTSAIQSTPFSEGDLIRFKRPIHSVKRLTDGEVFTIGQRVFWYPEMNNDITTITEFRLIENKNINVYGEGFGIDFSCLKKATPPKVPLFTTDGLDIFEGESYWIVTPTFNIDYWKFNRFTPDTVFYQPLKVFSTEEKAKEYIFLNMPRTVTFKDILSYWAKDYLLFKALLEQNFKL